MTSKAAKWRRRFLATSAVTIAASGVVVSASAVGTSNYATTVLADHPIGYWRLGEAPGATTAVDSSGYGRNAAYPACVRTGLPGALAGDPDTSAKFQTRGFQTPGCYATYKPQGGYRGSFTAEAWVYALGTVDQQYRTFIDTRAPGGDFSGEYSFDFKLTGTAYPGGQRLYADVGNGSRWLGQAASVSFSWKPRVWYYVVATVSNGHVELYVNAEKVADVPIASGIPLLSNARHPLYIGDDPRFDQPTDGEQFNGRIDEVALYAKVLTPAQVSAHYQAGRPS